MRQRNLLAALVALLAATSAWCADEGVVVGAVNIASAEAGGRVVAASSEVRERGKTAR